MSNVLFLSFTDSSVVRAFHMRMPSIERAHAQDCTAPRQPTADRSTRRVAFRNNIANTSRVFNEPHLDLFSVQSLLPVTSSRLTVNLILF